MIEALMWVLIGGLTALMILLAIADGGGDE